MQKPKPFMAILSPSDNNRSRYRHVTQILPLRQRGGVPGTSGKLSLLRSKCCLTSTHLPSVRMWCSKLGQPSSPMKGEIMDSLRMAEQKGKKSLGLLVMSLILCTNSGAANFRTSC